MNAPDDNRLKDAEREIVNIISSVTGIQLSPLDEDLYQLKLDSLTRLEIMTLLEKHFVLELTEDVASEFTSISRIARIIRQVSNSGME